MTPSVFPHPDAAPTSPSGTFEELLGLLEKRLMERSHAPDHGERLRMAAEKAISAGRSTMFDYPEKEPPRLRLVEQTDEAEQRYFYGVAAE